MFLIVINYFIITKFISFFMDKYVIMFTIDTIIALKLDIYELWFKKNILDIIFVDFQLMTKYYF